MIRGGRYVIIPYNAYEKRFSCPPSPRHTRTALENYWNALKDFEPNLWQLSYIFTLTLDLGRTGRVHPIAMLQKLFGEAEEVAEEVCPSHHILEDKVGYGRECVCRNDAAKS